MHVGAGYGRQVLVDQQPADLVAAQALAEARTLRDTGAPRFLHVHFMDPHAPYCAPAGYSDLAGIPGAPPEVWCEDSYAPNYVYPTAPPDVRAALHAMMTALYAGELRYWDAMFGQLWTDLDAEGLLDDTLVVFATDHGQQFFERGSHGHGLALGGEENRALGAFWAKNLRPNAWTGPTVHQDVAATLFELFGLTTTDPVSGLRIGEAPSDRPSRAMNIRLDGPIQLSLVRGDTQLLYDWSGERAFYTLATDPAGVLDVYDPLDPAVVAAWGDMTEFIGDVRGLWPHLAPPVDAQP
jgi:hypothetical protein